MPTNQFLIFSLKEHIRNEQEASGNGTKNAILAPKNAQMAKAKHKDLYHSIITSQHVLQKHSNGVFHWSLKYIQDRFQKQSYQNFTRAESGIKTHHSAKLRQCVTSQCKKQKRKRMWQV